MTDVKKLRDYYDTTDQSALLEEATLETETVDELLVSTSIRLSKRTLDQVRALAKAAGVPATTLMRSGSKPASQGARTRWSCPSPA